MKKMFAVVVALSLLGGCAVHTREGSVIIDPVHHDDHYYRDGGGNGGNFCPPGQAKKGNC